MADGSQPGAPRGDGHGAAAPPPASPSGSARLYRLVSELAKAVTHAQVARVAVVTAVEELGASAAVVYARIDGRYRLIAQHGLDLGVEWQELSTDAPVPLARVIATGTAELYATRRDLIEAYPVLRDRAVTPEAALQALAALPLVLDGQVLGGLAYSFASAQEFDRAFYAALAGQFAQAMERARLYGELRLRAEREAEQARVVETLLRTSTILSSELDLDRLFQKLTDEATRLCRARFGAFFYNTVDEMGEAYLLYTISGVPREAFSQFPMPRNTLVFAPTFHGTGIVRMDDVTKDPRYGKNPPYHGMPPGHLPVRSYLAAPVKSSSGEVLGGLFLGHEVAGVFRDDDERLLVAVAAQAAVALDNARLYRDARAARDLEERRARLAEEVGIALTGVATFDHKLHQCAAALVARLDLAAARVWTLDRGAGQLERRASAGLTADGEEAEERVAPGRDRAIGQIALDGRPLAVNPGGAPPEGALPAWARLPGVAAFAGHPLTVEGQTVGVLAVSSRRPLRESALALLGAVADQIAVAIASDLGERERERFRELFIGMLGHDLRNPLSAVSTGAQALLMGEGLPERSSRSLQRIRASAARMSRMVNQLLDFARSRDIGSGIPLQRARADLRAVARDVVEELRSSHAGRVIEEDYVGDVLGMWDVDRMAQVFSNLVGNALTYADPARGIQVQLHREQDSVTALVTSIGRPIAPDVLPALFDPFRRAREGRTVGTQGLGLGLYITRQIVLAHGGAIDVSSSVQGLTTFHLRLPIVPVE